MWKARNDVCDMDWYACDLIWMKLYPLLNGWTPLCSSGQKMLLERRLQMIERRMPEPRSSPHKMVLKKRRISLELEGPGARAYRVL